MKPIILDIKDVISRHDAEEVADAIRYIPASAFTQYTDPDFEYLKSACNDMAAMPSSIQRVIEHLQSTAFIRRVEKWTGLQYLVPDLGLWGGGVHVTLPGGYLAMHRDFNVLPTTYRDALHLRRAVNLIMYLTPNWDTPWRGELQIEGYPDVGAWFGSTVMFDPSETFHGHPEPYRGPVPRQSIAVYYYVLDSVPREKWRSTEYRPLPWKKDTIEADLKRRGRADARTRYAKWWLSDEA